MVIAYQRSLLYNSFSSSMTTIALPWHWAKDLGNVIVAKPLKKCLLY